MADAMDWHPTTPPTAHNPYSNPLYIPGGWPMSPPPFQYTSGVFARKRESTCVRNVVKRVCTGLKTVGSFALLPVKPVYLIVRHFHSRQNRERRRSSRSSTRSRQHHSPALRAQIEAAERQLKASQTNSQSQQISTPPSTPPIAYGDLDVSTRVQTDLNQGIESTETTLQSPAAVSVTDSETTVHTLALERSTKDSSINTHLRAGSKRSREEIGNASNTYEDYSTSENPRAAQENLPEPDKQKSKKMKRANRFDANYKFNPTAYSGKGASPGIKTNPIGVKLEDSEPDTNVFGGWTFEMPIATGQTSSVSPSEQVQSNSETHVPEKPPPKSFQHREEQPTEFIASTIVHDERWESSNVLEMFFPDDYFETEATLKDPKTNEAKHTHSGSMDKPGPAALMKVLESMKTPSEPPIKPRPFNPAPREFTLRSRAVSKQNADEDDKVVETHEDSHTSVKAEDSDITKLNDTEVVDQSDAFVVESGKNIEKEDLSIALPTQQASIPETPLKVVAVKPAKEDPETPAAQLEKLKVSESGNNDTPKATPHSGTKTVRVTRYQRAQEEARKAKLEQYELVAVSADWDRKVRHAVRSGIPGYLGPGDLARVAPQYAGRGQDNWLNDETINKYLEIVAAHGRKNDRPGQVSSHHAFNNFFYNNLRSKGAESVVRWSKRAKIGGRNLMYVDRVFVPINSGAHWTLAVVEPTQKRITHYNSMRGTATGIRACEDLKNWVAVELGKDFKEEEWTLIAAGESPQQTNSDDCGVFTITSARQIMLGYTPMSYGHTQITNQRVRIVAELINQGLLRSVTET